MKTNHQQIMPIAGQGYGIEFVSELKIERILKGSAFWAKEALKTTVRFVYKLLPQLCERCFEVRTIVTWTTTHAAKLHLAEF